MEHGIPMTFHVRRPGGSQREALYPDPNSMSAQECGAYGEHLLGAGNWFDAERYFFAQLEKGRQGSDLNQQAMAYSMLGNIYCFRGDLNQGLELYHHAMVLAKQANNIPLGRNDL